MFRASKAEISCGPMVRVCVASLCISVAGSSGSASLSIDSFLSLGRERRDTKTRSLRVQKAPHFSIGPARSYIEFTEFITQTWFSRRPYTHKMYT